MPSQQRKFQMQLDSSVDVSVILMCPLSCRKKDLLNVLQYTRGHPMETNLKFWGAFVES